jgi:hypothetical protein
MMSHSNLVQLFFALTDQYSNLASHIFSPDVWL